MGDEDWASSFYRKRLKKGKIIKPKHRDVVQDVNSEVALPSKKYLKGEKKERSRSTRSIRDKIQHDQYLGFLYSQPKKMVDIDDFSRKEAADAGETNAEEDEEKKQRRKNKRNRYENCFEIDRRGSDSDVNESKINSEEENGQAVEQAYQLVRHKSDDDSSSNERNVLRIVKNNKKRPKIVKDPSKDKRSERVFEPRNEKEPTADFEADKAHLYMTRILEMNRWQCDICNY